MKFISIADLEKRYHDEISNPRKRCVTGYLSWGGRRFYELNSDVPYHLNGTYDDFIKNELGEIQCWESGPEEYEYFFDGKLITEKEYNAIWVNENILGETNDELDFRTDIKLVNTTKYWWGKTLDQYYPHPYFTDKEIIGFKVIRNLPFYKINEIYYLNDDKNLGDDWSEVDYSLADCLKYPEFFEPIYDKIKECSITV